MPDSYIRRAERYGWTRLRRLWDEILGGSVEGWPEGRALEHLVLRAFVLNGASVRRPYQVSLNGETVEQIDGALYVDGLACLIECKDTSGRVNVEPLAKLGNQLSRRHSGVLGIVFSRGGFTDPALTLAQFMAPQAILLWNGEEIAYALGKKDFRSMLLKKYRYCVETGLADYDSRAEDLP